MWDSRFPAEDYVLNFILHKLKFNGVSVMIYSYWLHLGLLVFLKELWLLRYILLFYILYIHPHPLMSTISSMYVLIFFRSTESMQIFFCWHEYWGTGLIGLYNYSTVYLSNKFKLQPQISFMPRNVDNITGRYFL